MLRLPRLSAGVSSWRLPLFPRTAVALANALAHAQITADRNAAEHALGPILRSDPALTLWLLCRRPFASCFDQKRSASITLVQALMKSAVNFAFASSEA